MSEHFFYLLGINIKNSKFYKNFEDGLIFWNFIEFS